jgi:hypothetical protein
MLSSTFVLNTQLPLQQRLIPELDGFKTTIRKTKEAHRMLLRLYGTHHQIYNHCSERYDQTLFDRSEVPDARISKPLQRNTTKGETWDETRHHLLVR